MADFAKIHKRNNRFSVNRDLRIFLKLSEVEVETWKSLVAVLQERRNTGSEVETFLYLCRKYLVKIEPKKKNVRNEWGTVDRKKGLLFKVNENEKSFFKACIDEYKSSAVETFMHIVDREYYFQDELEIINER